eukprot:15320887-Alexandrium_andersonii.AAC.1
MPGGFEITPRPKAGRRGHPVEPRPGLTNGGAAWGAARTGNDEATPRRPGLDRGGQIGLSL